MKLVIRFSEEDLYVSAIVAPTLCDDVSACCFLHRIVNTVRMGAVLFSFVYPGSGWSLSLQKSMEREGQWREHNDGSSSGTLNILKGGSSSSTLSIPSFSVSLRIE